MASTIIIVTILVTILAQMECKKIKLVDLVPICSLSDPNLNQCATRSAQKILPILKSGVRDLHLIPLDPLQVPSLDFGQDTGPVSLSWKFYNATIKGTGSAIVNSIRLDKNGYKFEGDFTFPRFELSGDYLGKGRILLLPIDGQGFGNITTTDMNVTVAFNCETITRKNVDYLSIEKLKLHFKYGKTYLSFTRLFGDNKELGAATNKFLNENTDDIVEEMRGTLEEAFGQLNKQIMNNVFNNVPLREAFKD